MATYYVGYDGSGTLGNDANAGTSFALRKATVAAGLALMTADGDVLIICANSTYMLALGGDLPRTNATATPSRIVGGNPANSGAIDGTIAWIDLASGAASGLRDNGVARAGWLIQNIGVKRATSHGFAISSSLSRSVTFLNCYSQSNGGDGFNVSHRQVQFIGCVASLNTGSGFVCASSLIDCIAIGNTSHGFNLLAVSNRGVFLYRFIGHANGGKGVNLTLSGAETDSPSALVGCTLDGNTGDGLYLASAVNVPLIAAEDCIISNNGGYGINAAAAAVMTRLRCHCYNNTSGNFNNLSLPDVLTADETSGDPKFADYANDSFRPLIGSPAIRSTGNYAGATPPYRRDWAIAEASA